MGLDGESSPGLAGGGRPLGALGAFLHAPHTPPYLGSTPPPAAGGLHLHPHPHNPHFPYEGMGAFTALGESSQRFLHVSSRQQRPRLSWMGVLNWQ